MLHRILGLGYKTSSPENQLLEDQLLDDRKSVYEKINRFLRKVRRVYTYLLAIKNKKKFMRNL